VSATAVNCQSCFQTYVPLYVLPAFKCSNILVCILLLAVLSLKLPDRGRAILLQQTTKFSLKNLFNSKRRNIHQHFNVTGLCKIFVVYDRVLEYLRL
jgi:hypothetical protein